MELIDLDPNDDDILDQSEAEKLSQTHKLTDKHRINILSGPALRVAPAKMKTISKKKMNLRIILIGIA